jgi:hypothetical protein
VDQLLDTAHKARYDGCVDTNDASSWQDDNHREVIMLSTKAIMTETKLTSHSKPASRLSLLPKPLVKYNILSFFIAPDDKKSDLPSSHALIQSKFIPFADLLQQQLRTKRAARLLEHVSRGKQEEAEAIIKTNPNLLQYKEKVTDYSGQTTYHLTAFQRALRDTDSHMWRMMLKYLTKDEAAKQLQELESKVGCDLIVMNSPPDKNNLNMLPILSTAAYIRYEDKLFYINKLKHECVELTVDIMKFDSSFKPTELLFKTDLEKIKKMTGHIATDIESWHYNYQLLIQAIQHFLSPDNAWMKLLDRIMRAKQFCKKVGGAQRSVPTHIAQEYCHPIRTFKSPKFASDTLYRQFNVTQFSESPFWFPLKKNDSKSMLGINMAYIRGDLGHPIAVTYCDDEHSLRQDLYAIEQLAEVRITELNDLKQRLLNPVADEKPISAPAKLMLR